MLRTGPKLLAFDRRLGARFVAGADEAGRGSLAGPLVTAGVLFDYALLRDHAVRPLALLNDSKQVSPEGREALFCSVARCATRISIHVIPPGHYFMMGDNRAASCDSRVWGSVPRKNLIGEVFMIYWPPQRWSFR